MNFDDLIRPDDERPRTPEEALQKQVDAFEHFLKQSLAQIRRDPQAAGPQLMFEKFNQLVEQRIFSYPKINDNLLQLLQAYSQDMITSLKEQNSGDAYHAAAGIYSTWLETYQNHPEYDADKVEDMIDQNGEWMLNNAATYQNYYMGTEALTRTVTTQTRLLDRTSDPEKLLARKRKTAVFLVNHASYFLTDLPHATESGLEEKMLYDGEGGDQPFYDPDRNEYKSMHHVKHVYSYARKASDIYCYALDLVQRTSPAKGVPKFIERTQPALSVALAGKYQEFHSINTQSGKAKDYRAPDSAQAVKCMGYAINVLKESSPEKVTDFIGEAYGDVSAELIEFGEVAALMAVYDAAIHALPVHDSSRTDFTDSFASRNIYQMMKLEDYDQAGIFLNHLHKESGLPSTHMLLLLDLNKENIVGAAVSLQSRDQIQPRASVVYAASEGNAPQLARILYKQKNPGSYISFAPEDPELKIKGHYAQQISDISEKIQNNAMKASPMVLSSRWLSLDCKNV